VPIGPRTCLLGAPGEFSTPPPAALDRVSLEWLNPSVAGAVPCLGPVGSSQAAEPAKLDPGRNRFQQTCATRLQRWTRSNARPWRGFGASGSASLYTACNSGQFQIVTRPVLVEIGGNVFIDAEAQARKTGKDNNVFLYVVVNVLIVVMEHPLELPRLPRCPSRAPQA
jgi:hypothetical protein